MSFIATIFIPSALADSISTEIDGVNYDIDYTGNNIILKSITAETTTDAVVAYPTPSAPFEAL